MAQEPKPDAKESTDVPDDKKHGDFVLPHLIQGAYVDSDVWMMQIRDKTEYPENKYYVLADSNDPNPNKVIELRKFCFRYNIREPIVFVPRAMMGLQIVSVNIFVAEKEMRDELDTLKSKFAALSREYYGGGSEARNKEKYDALTAVAEEEMKLMQKLFEKNYQCFYQVMLNKGGQYFLIELQSNQAYIKFSKKVDFTGGPKYFQDRVVGYETKDRLKNMEIRLATKFDLIDGIRVKLQQMVVHPYILRCFMPCQDLSNDNKKIMTFRACALLRDDELNIMEAVAIKLTTKGDADEAILKPLRFELTKDDFKSGASEKNQVYVVPSSCFGGVLFAQNLKAKLEGNLWRENKEWCVLSQSGRDKVAKGTLDILTTSIVKNCGTSLPPNYLLKDDISVDIFKEEFELLYEELAAIAIDAPSAIDRALATSKPQAAEMAVSKDLVTSAKSNSHDTRSNDVTSPTVK